MASDDILRRLKVIEGALGIDLDSTDRCSGDPMDCEAEPCSPERCPIANSHVQQLFIGAQAMTDFLSHAFGVLEDLGTVPQGFLALVERRTELALSDRNMEDLGVARAEYDRWMEDLRVARAEYDRLRKEMMDADASHQNG